MKLWSQTVVSLGVRAAPWSLGALLTAIICAWLVSPVMAGEAFDYNVGVYYYPWHHNDFHGGQYLRNRLVPPQLPELGEYNDREAPVIAQHLAWSRQAGIDFWVASWWGPDSREDITLRSHILSRPDLGDFKIAVFYETVGRTNDFTSYANLGPDLTHLANQYFGHPNYLRIDGRPVLFIYLTRVLASRGTLQSSLTTMRTAALDAGYDIYIIGDHAFGAPRASAADLGLMEAVTNYDVYGSLGASGYSGQAAVDRYVAAQSGWKGLAEAAASRFVPAAAPGFNDKAVRDGHAPLSRKLTAGAEFGSLFRALLRGAKPQTDPNLGRMMMITSWNEWHEDTQIEPVALAPPTSRDDSPSGSDLTRGLPYEGYGQRYLDILFEETVPQITSAHGWGSFR